MIKAFAGLFLILFGMCMPGYADIGFDRLTCEYKENPLGIATHRPRFSWVMTSGESGQSQSGYELMVAYSLRDLRKGKGEVWSTGKVHSSQSVHLAYDGKPLQSFTRYYWRVRVYDQDGKASAWKIGRASCRERVCQYG